MGIELIWSACDPFSLLKWLQSAILSCADQILVEMRWQKCSIEAAEVMRTLSACD